MTIQQECTARNIDRLFHFTRAENVPWILKSGLLLPSYIRTNALDIISNDPYRYDGLDAICLSIEWPNYKMFYTLRCNTPPETKWAVLEINHSVLWEKDCCFSVTNAADNSVNSIPVAQRSGLSAFQRLFEDYGEKARVNLNIHDYFPTNPQAEVSCLNPIEPQYIKAVWFDDIGEAQAVNNLHSYVRFNNQYHKPRSDYTHWQ